LTDTSEATMPLIADGWVAGGIAYSTNKTVAGGVWGGTKAVVIFVDGSGQVMKVNDTVNTLVLRPGRAYNLFINTASTPQDPWFTATNFQLNPL